MHYASIASTWSDFGKETTKVTQMQVSRPTPVNSPNGQPDTPPQLPLLPGDNENAGTTTTGTLGQVHESMQAVRTPPKKRARKHVRFDDVRRRKKKKPVRAMLLGRYYDDMGAEALVSFLAWVFFASLIVYAVYTLKSINSELVTLRALLNVMNARAAKP